MTGKRRYNTRSSNTSEKMHNQELYFDRIKIRSLISNISSYIATMEINIFHNWSCLVPMAQDIFDMLEGAEKLSCFLEEKFLSMKDNQTMEMEVESIKYAYFRSKIIAYIIKNIIGRLGDINNDLTYETVFICEVKRHLHLIKKFGFKLPMDCSVIEREKNKLSFSDFAVMIECDLGIFSLKQTEEMKGILKKPADEICKAGFPISLLEKDSLEPDETQLSQQSKNFKEIQISEVEMPIVQENKYKRKLRATPTRSSQRLYIEDSPEEGPFSSKITSFAGNFRKKRKYNGKYKEAEINEFEALSTQENRTKRKSRASISSSAKNIGNNIDASSLDSEISCFPGTSSSIALKSNSCLKKKKRAHKKKPKDVPISESGAVNIQMKTTKRILRSATSSSKKFNIGSILEEAKLTSEITSFSGMSELISINSDNLLEIREEVHNKKNEDAIEPTSVNDMCEVFTPSHISMNENVIEETKTTNDAEVLKPTNSVTNGIREEEGTEPENINGKIDEISILSNNSMNEIEGTEPANINEKVKVSFPALNSMDEIDKEETKKTNEAEVLKPPNINEIEDDKNTIPVDTLSKVSIPFYDIAEQEEIEFGGEVTISSYDTYDQESDYSESTNKIGLNTTDLKTGSERTILSGSMNIEENTNKIDLNTTGFKTASQHTIVSGSMNIEEYTNKTGLNTTDLETGSEHTILSGSMNIEANPSTSSYETTKKQANPGESLLLCKNTTSQQTTLLISTNLESNVVKKKRKYTKKPKVDASNEMGPDRKLENNKKRKLNTKSRKLEETASHGTILSGTIHLEENTNKIGLNTTDLETGPQPTILSASMGIEEKTNKIGLNTTGLKTASLPTILSTSMDIEENTNKIGLNTTDLETGSQPTILSPSMEIEENNNKIGLNTTGLKTASHPTILSASMDIEENTNKIGLNTTGLKTASQPTILSASMDIEENTNKIGLNTTDLETGSQPTILSTSMEIEESTNKIGLNTTGLKTASHPTILSASMDIEENTSKISLNTTGLKTASQHSILSGSMNIEENAYRTDFNPKDLETATQLTYCSCPMNLEGINTTGLETGSQLTILNSSMNIEENTCKIGLNSTDLKTSSQNTNFTSFMDVKANSSTSSSDTIKKQPNPGESLLLCKNTTSQKTLLLVPPNLESGVVKKKRKYTKKQKIDVSNEMGPDRKLENKKKRKLNSKSRKLEENTNKIDLKTTGLETVSLPTILSGSMNIEDSFLPAQSLEAEQSVKEKPLIQIAQVRNLEESVRKIDSKLSNKLETKRSVNLKKYKKSIISIPSIKVMKNDLKMDLKVVNNENVCPKIEEDYLLKEDEQFVNLNIVKQENKFDQDAQSLVLGCDTNAVNLTNNVNPNSFITSGSGMDFDIEALTSVPSRKSEEAVTPQKVNDYFSGGGFSDSTLEEIIKVIDDPSCEGNNLKKTLSGIICQSRQSQLQYSSMENPVMHEDNIIKIPLIGNVFDSNSAYDCKETLQNKILVTTDSPQIINTPSDFCASNKNIIDNKNYLSDNEPKVSSSRYLAYSSDINSIKIDSKAVETTGEELMNTEQFLKNTLDIDYSQNIMSSNASENDLNSVSLAKITKCKYFTGNRVTGAKSLDLNFSDLNWE